ncbi:hypothetical protein [uncultured Sphingomonas sp.]|uniref:hypothetical protein n=1 Tax=uncultured Sphingomonas sp. TaxID=158754 RepID=UPI0025E68AD5|nr:hypothetical protein [uncultured Sphingomonas sp.]
MTRRRILVGIGFAAFAMGMLWVGQGLGWVRWPQSSFMIDQRPWITRGSVLAVLGLGLVLYARRTRR